MFYKKNDEEPLIIPSFIREHSLFPSPTSIKCLSIPVMIQLDYHEKNVIKANKGLGNVRCMKCRCLNNSLDRWVVVDVY